MIVYDSDGCLYVFDEVVLFVELFDVLDYLLVLFDFDDVDSEFLFLLVKVIEWVYVDLDFGDGLKFYSCDINVML